MGFSAKLLSLIEKIRKTLGQKSSDDSVPIAQVSIPIKWTGHKSVKNRDQLIEVICEVYDKVWQKDRPYAPKDGVTYCNFAATEIAGAMGCNDLHGKLANEIATMMESSSNWLAIPMAQAQNLANQGSLVFAIAKASPHGHLCVIRPGLEGYSSKWGVKVPACMNIGKDCFIGDSVNWAFQSPPNFYVWKQSF